MHGDTGHDKDPKWWPAVSLDQCGLLMTAIHSPPTGFSGPLGAAKVPGRQIRTLYVIRLVRHNLGDENIYENDIQLGGARSWLHRSRILQ